MIKENYIIDPKEDPKSLQGWKDGLKYWENRLIEDRKRLNGSDFIELNPEIKRIKWNIERTKTKMSRNKKLIKKWEESGLLDDIDNMTTSSMAEMMESEAMQLLRDKWDKEENQNKDE